MVNSHNQCGVWPDIPVSGGAAGPLDYNLLIDKIIKVVPHDLRPIGNVEPLCPYCDAYLKEKPNASKKCPSCRNIIHVQKRPLDGIRVLLTDEQLEVLGIQEYISRGDYARQIETLKEKMQGLQSSGNRTWLFDGGIYGRFVPLEAFCMHGRVITAGSPEEREALIVLCTPGCSGGPLPAHGTFSDDYSYAAQRYERALEVLQLLPESRQKSDYARGLRKIVGYDE
ncbi:hypothetical protein [uncultured Methanofollis sp.]|mgnify:CR=1 FL=1|uniref:hypothetical protein n=1 Tax=uncultured Methanofollis sp. TaxID=262500 RepID=UPI002633DA85|nr:hypothetical protein [uncultured Methanofollis sp.]